MSINYNNSNYTDSKKNINYYCNVDPSILGKNVSDNSAILLNDICNSNRYSTNPYPSVKNMDTPEWKEFNRVLGYNDYNPKNLQKIPEHTQTISLRENVGVSIGDDEDEGDKFKKAMLMLLPNMIKGFFTPQTIAMLLALDGVPFSESLGLKLPGVKGLQEMIAKKMITSLTNISEKTIEDAASNIVGKTADKAAGELVAKLGDKITEDVAKDLIQRFTSAAIGEVAEEATGEAANAISTISADVAAKIAEAGAEEVIAGSMTALAIRSLSTFLTGIGSIMGILMLVNMVIDMWDPCGYNNTLNASTIQLFTDLYNNMYRQIYIGKVFVTNDREGNAIYSSEWPVEYFPDDVFINTDKGVIQTTNGPKKLDYEELYMEYYEEYLGNLTHNSNGYPICNRGDLQCESIIATKPLSPSDIDEIARIIQDFARGFDKNAQVDTFLERYWILIVFVIILIVILLFYIE